MAIFWISLLVIYSIANVVPAEAKVIAKRMAETTKNPNELALDELNQIKSDKTFGEIMQEINNRTKMSESEVESNWPECQTCQNYSICSEVVKCNLRALSKDSVVDFAALTFSEYILLTSDENLKDFIMNMCPDLLDVGMEKLQTVYIDLKKYSASFHQKSEQLTQLYYRWHRTSNDIREWMESRFEKANVDIDRVKTKLSNEIKMTNELMAKITGKRPYFKKGTLNIDSSNKLADAYEAYLLGHGIKLPQSSHARFSTLANQLTSELDRI